ncbi:hypothetical protein B0H10DRAFT_2001105 [Mycena sp. CBHHK59/15]|nr:hypothetical protein B0H10DRAFT_2001105 [Mycena sp. CBHHK59/15]
MSTEEKSDAKHFEVAVRSSSELDFGGDSTLPPPPVLTPAEERRLWRKVDLRLMPILSLMYLLSFLDRAAHRLFFGAASLAGAFSGLLAYGINFMGGRAVYSDGIATVLVGALAFFVLVDFPVTAKFLTLEERSFIVWRKKYDNSSVGEEEHFEMRHLVQALTDWQVWLHILIYMSIMGPLTLLTCTTVYGITLFLPFGHNVPISQLLTVPPYVSIVLYVFAYWSDRIQRRSPFIMAGLLMCLVGFSINISNAPSGVKYFGTFFCVAGSYAAFPGVVAWCVLQLWSTRRTQIVQGWAITVGAIASNIYRTQDKPRFIVGHGCELMFVGIGLICVPAAVLIYTRINNRRDEAARAELREMGDRAPDFRYTI